MSFKQNYYYRWWIGITIVAITLATLLSSWLFFDTKRFYFRKEISSIQLIWNQTELYLYIVEKATVKRTKTNSILRRVSFEGEDINYHTLHVWEVKNGKMTQKDLDIDKLSIWPYPIFVPYENSIFEVISENCRKWTGDSFDLVSPEMSRQLREIFIPFPSKHEYDPWQRRDGSDIDMNKTGIVQNF